MNKTIHHIYIDFLIKDAMLDLNNKIIALNMFGNRLTWRLGSVIQDKYYLEYGINK